jgi:hypothetical protein
MLANVSRGAEKEVIKDFEERVELPLELAAAVLLLSRERIERVQCEMFIYAEAALNNVAHAASGRQECVQVRVEGFLPIWSADDRTPRPLERRSVRFAVAAALTASSAPNGTWRSGASAQRLSTIHHA